MVITRLVLEPSSRLAFGASLSSSGGECVSVLSLDPEVRGLQVTD